MSTANAYNITLRIKELCQLTSLATSFDHGPDGSGTLTIYDPSRDGVRTELVAFTGPNALEHVQFWLEGYNLGKERGYKWGKKDAQKPLPF